MAAETIPGPIQMACQEVRPATPADAVVGVLPSLVAAPASTQECADLLAAAASLGLAVLPRGTGSRMHWGNPPGRCDLVIEMTRMDRVVEHAAGDLVATVEAGVSLDRLAEVLGDAGQRLALDPPAADLLAGRTRGTVGGVLATGAAGPLRLRYGTPRDLLLGITVVRADGTVARSGGKVVKNVAGYDLGKLFAGSRGTLGLITQATFRLHPVPASVAYVSVDCAAAVDACQIIAAVLDSPLAPVAAEIAWPGADAPVGVCFAIEGEPAAVAERALALGDLIRSRTRPTAEADPPPPWWEAGPSAQRDGTVLQIAFWPGDLGMVLAEIRAVAEAARLDPAVGGSAAAGVLHVAVPADRDPGAIAAFVAGLRRAAGHGLPGQVSHRLREVPRLDASRAGHGGHGRNGGLGHASADGHKIATPGEPRSQEGPPARANVVVLHAPPAVGALVDLFGPVPSLALMRAVKDQFDPGRILSPGRFAGGI